MPKLFVLSEEVPHRQPGIYLSDNRSKLTVRFCSPFCKARKPDGPSFCPWMVGEPFEDSKLQRPCEVELGCGWDMGRSYKRRQWFCTGTCRPLSLHRIRRQYGYFQTFLFWSHCRPSSRSVPIKLHQVRSCSIRHCGIHVGSSSCERDGFLPRDSEEVEPAGTSESKEARRSPQGAKAEGEAQSKGRLTRKGGGGRLSLSPSDPAAVVADDGCRTSSISRQVEIRVPGSQAGVYEGRKIFQSLFRHFVSSRSGLGRFARSLIGLNRGPKIGFSVSSSVGFPMPLPFPEVCISHGVRNDPEVAAKFGVNAVVLVLNYLHLGQTCLAPETLRIGNRLSAMQWKAVRLLKKFLHAWVVAESVDPVSMGRSAAKVESIEEALADLECRAKSLQPDGVNAYLPSASLKDECGLGSEGAGVVVGPTNHAAFSTFSEVDPSRLAFVGEPVFDPIARFWTSAVEEFSDFQWIAAETQTPFKVPSLLCRSIAPEARRPNCSSCWIAVDGWAEIRKRFCSGMFAVAKSLIGTAWYWTHDHLTC